MLATPTYIAHSMGTPARGRPKNWDDSSQVEKFYSCFMDSLTPVYRMPKGHRRNERVFDYTPEVSDPPDFAQLYTQVKLFVKMRSLSSCLRFSAPALANALVQWNAAKKLHLGRQSKGWARREIAVLILMLRHLELHIAKCGEDGWDKFVSGAFAADGPKLALPAPPKMLALPAPEPKYLPKKPGVSAILPMWMKGEASDSNDESTELALAVPEMPTASQVYLSDSGAPAFVRQDGAEQLGKIAPHPSSDGFAQATFGNITVEMPAVVFSQQLVDDGTAWMAHDKEQKALKGKPSKLKPRKRRRRQKEKMEKKEKKSINAEIDPAKKKRKICKGNTEGINAEGAPAKKGQNIRKGSTTETATATGTQMKKPVCCPYLLYRSQLPAADVSNAAALWGRMSVEQKHPFKEAAAKNRRYCKENNLNTGARISSSSKKVKPLDHYLNTRPTGMARSARFEEWKALTPEQRKNFGIQTKDART